MSYGPPPARTPYGDQDFIKEDWPQQQTVSEHNQGIPFNASTKSVYPMPPSHQAPVYGQPSPDNSLVQNLNQPSVIPLAEATKSLTHDDILFLRSWRQDSFYYRVLPLSAVGAGTLYYYNKVKNLPQKASHFFMVAAAGYIVGKWSYRDELKRRLANSQSTTPYMQALRNIMGVPPIGASGFVSDAHVDRNEIYKSTNYSPGGNYNDGSLFSPESGIGSSFAPPTSSTFGQYNNNQGFTDQSLEPHESISNFSSSDNEQPSRSVTSYEELRARNRGLLVK